MAEQANPRCQVTTVDPASISRSDSCVWCMLPAGHAGLHRAEIPQDDAMPAVLEWRAEVPPVEWVYGVRFDLGVEPWVSESESLEKARKYVYRFNTASDTEKVEVVRRRLFTEPEWEPIPEEGTE